MKWSAKWIKPETDLGEVVPLFFKKFRVKAGVETATLIVTAQGVYEAMINSTRVSSYILAPGWTTYEHRLQYQAYDVSSMLIEENSLEVLVGTGWYRSPQIGWKVSEVQKRLCENPVGLLAQLIISYTDGTTEVIGTDKSWFVKESSVRFSDIYDGEIYDATFQAPNTMSVVEYEGPWNTLIPQEGEEILEQERLSVANIFTTPAGEIVIDFGQEITGYLEVTVEANAGDVVDLSFAEVMDKYGNFYTENYRSAKCQYHYICKNGTQSYKPHLTFYGFRYIRVNDFPGGVMNIKPENFTAIVVHSAFRRIGTINTSHPLLNRLFNNIIWGQKSNFLDIPTDCPQRDERLGWTGDAQVFVKAACLNFDVEKFFTKWLADMAADQHEDGYIGHVIPDIIQDPNASSAWGDAATICPWEVYMAYGNPTILEKQFSCMKGWVDYITITTKDANLWTGGAHYGDWLGLDAPSGSYKGSSRLEFIASAYYAYSTSLVIKAGKVLGKDVSVYETLYKNIVGAFQKTFPEYMTQTECALAVHFRLAKDPKASSDQLADMLRSCGVKLQTGFVGTPYILHALSDFGHADLAYSLLLREQYPSWLYPVTKGATTVWEHWDGIMENGDFWSADMNSYNHYAYGAVADWMYGVAAGIKPVEEAPGYKKVSISPIPDARLEWFEASLDTAYGIITSKWVKEKERFRYDITTPVEAVITIAGKMKTVPAGSYVFYSMIER